jgi:hypothetical protein
MPRETPRQRAARLTLYQGYIESGQSLSEFSRERGTTPWKLRHAIRKTESEASGKPGFQELGLPPGIESGGEYAVQLKNGRELRIPAHFSEKRVRQLVEILESC